MSGVRVRYSGLIALVSGMINTVMGLVFVLIITRNLTLEEFGTWSLINSMIIHFLIVESIITFWTIRQVARGDEVGRTSIISTAIFAIAAIPVYLIASIFVSDNSNAQHDAMLFGGLLIPVFFLRAVISQINTAHRPQIISYGLLVTGVSKIILVLALLHTLDLGLYGALTALLVAFLADIVFQIYFARGKLRNKFSLVDLKRWGRLSWVSLASHMPGFLIHMDILVYTLITGSVVGVAYYGAAVAITRIVAHASRINHALYPKLLARGSYAHVSENLRLLLYLALPILAIAIVFSEPALYALNPAYRDGSLIVAILAVKSLFSVVVEMFRQVLMGVESVDINKDAGFKSILHSKLIFTSGVWSIKSAVTIVILVAILYITNVPGISEVELVVNWVLVLVGVEAPFLIYAFVLLRKSVDFKVSITHVFKYAAASLALVSVYYATSEHMIIYHESIFDFLPGLMLQFLLCVGVYLGTTYLIDRKTRKLVRLVFDEVVKR